MPTPTNNDDLVTAAVFGDYTQAMAARIHLEESGIPAFLQDEFMSQGLFVVGGATGGVQLQVPTSRLDEAVRLINDRMPEQSARVDWSDVDVGEPEADEPVDDEEIPLEPRPETTVRPEQVVEIEPGDLTLRERRANRIVLGSLIGIFFWPVYFLAVWRLIQIANSEERLRPEYQRKANLGTVIIVAGLPLVLLSSCAISAARGVFW
jgi:Putative prokaryotic signal transducing protein